MSNTKIAVFYTHLGPYHSARLNALNKIFPRTCAVEIASGEKIYPWKYDRSLYSFKRKILFPEDSIDDVPVKAQCESVQVFLDEFNPDFIAVAGYGEPSMRAAAAWARKNNVPVILLFASTMKGNRRPFLKEIIKRFWIRQYSAVAALGTAAEEYALALGVPKHKIYKIGNVVDNQYFTGTVEKLKNKANEIRSQYGLPKKFFVCVSRFSEEKNLFGLLDAFVLYRRSGGEWDLVLVGGGPLQSDIQKHISDNNIKGVHLFGWHSYDELPIFYMLGSGLILPSFRETWGLVVNEAMACGLPVLVSRNCGCEPDLCREGVNGYSFEPENLEEIKNTMLKIYNLEISNSARQSQRIISNFTPETWADKIKKIIADFYALKK